MFVWGIVAFATAAPLQMHIVETAKAAPNLASTLNIGAFNIGDACGAWLGGLMIDWNYKLDTLPWLAAGIAGAALLLVLLAKREKMATVHS